MKNYAILLPVVFLWSTMAVAQNAPALCSDRPGNATPTCVAQPGAIQIETSLIDWTRNEDGSVETNSYLFGDSLIKFGIAGDTELRVGFMPYQYDRSESAGRVSSAEGLGDISLSARHRLIEGSALGGLSFAVQPFLSLPVGSAEVSAGTWSAGFVAPVDIPGPNNWSFNLSPMVAALADSDGDGRHFLYSGTVAAGRSLSRNLSATLELFAERDRDPAGHTTTVTADGMLAMQAGPDTQFDVATYVGLSDDAPAIELIMGFTRRFRP